MKLSQILEGIACETRLPPDTEIGRITCDSRTVDAGDVFVCVKGFRSDGHAHAPGAVKGGAAAVVCERDLGLENQVLVENSRVAYAAMCANEYGNPQRGLHLIGVTGTNGKTTITTLVRDILRHQGLKTGLIGTIQSEIGDMAIPARHTTPDPAQLFSLLGRMRAAGIEYVVMEVSSHALSQHRVHGLRFDCAAFTNLTQDHLDYHGTMENYYQAKRRLFLAADKAVVNIDDEYGRRLLGDIPCPAATFSVGDDGAGYTAREAAFSAQGSRFVVVHGAEIHRARVCMPGLYSVSNALCALALAVEGCSVPLPKAIEGLAASKGVLGRTEIIEAPLPFTVMRDYAHAPDGLLKVLTTVREFAKGRIVTLFGCAGERDREKRKEMGRIVAAHSDQVVLTSDNPRSEDPMQIIGDTLPGFAGLGTPVQVFADRYEAIRWAIENCRPGDILLLLGKGHEDYQVLKHGTIFFDERFIVREIAQKLQEQDSV